MGAELPAVPWRIRDVLVPIIVGGALVVSFFADRESVMFGVARPVAWVVLGSLLVLALAGVARHRLGPPPEGDG